MNKNCSFGRVFTHFQRVLRSLPRPKTRGLMFDSLCIKRQAMMRNIEKRYSVNVEKTEVYLSSTYSKEILHQENVQSVFGVFGISGKTQRCQRHKDETSLTANAPCLGETSDIFQRCCMSF